MGRFIELIEQNVKYLCFAMVINCEIDFEELNIRRMLLKVLKIYFY